MRKIILSLGFGLLGLWGLFGIVWFVSSIKDPQRGFSITLQVAHFATSPCFIPGILIFTGIMFGAAFSPLVIGYFTHALKKKRLSHLGQKTMAKILSIEPMGILINYNPYVKVTVEVKPGITATFETVVSLLHVLQVGNSIEVLYDPANPSDAIPTP